MKPLFFAAALESGMSPDTILYDGPIEFANGYRPRNFEGRFFGPTTLQVALEHSRNIVTIRMVQEMGLRPALERVRAFNVVGPTDSWALPMEIPVVLGTTEVTPLELATAYLAFANLGTIPKPHFIEEVQNPNGLQLYRNVVEPKRVLESDVSSLMTQMLLGVMTHGSGRLTRSLLPQGLRHSAAGKSGTTNDNRDAWFVGYTPDYVVAVWVGFDRPLSLGEKRSGGQVAGPIWASFVSKLPVPEASAKPALELDARYQWVLLDLMTRLPAHGTEAGERLGWRIVGRPLERAPLAAVSPPGSY